MLSSFHIAAFCILAELMQTEIVGQTLVKAGYFPTVHSACFTGIETCGEIQSLPWKPVLPEEDGDGEVRTSGCLETAHIAHAQSPPLAGWRVAEGLDDFNWPKFSLWAWHLPLNTVRALKGEIKHNLWTGAKNTSAKEKSKCCLNIGYALFLLLTRNEIANAKEKWELII